MSSFRTILSLISFSLLALYSTGCASQQLLAVLDRDIKELRQQNARKQETLIETLRTIETLREDLGTAKYEKEEANSELATLRASVGIQHQSIDRLEAQKLKLQEKLQQAERSYERLLESQSEVKSLLNSTITELGAVRRQREQILSTAPYADQTRRQRDDLKRRIDEFRSQIIRERASRGSADPSQYDSVATTRDSLSDPTAPSIVRLTQPEYVSPDQETTTSESTLATDLAANASGDSNTSEDSILARSKDVVLGWINSEYAPYLFVGGCFAFVAVLFFFLIRALLRRKSTRSSTAEPVTEHEVEYVEFMDSDLPSPERDSEDTEDLQVASSLEEPVSTQPETETHGVEVNQSQEEDTVRESVPEADSSLNSTDRVKSPDGPVSVVPGQPPGGLDLLDALDWMNESKKQSQNVKKARKKKAVDAIRTEVVVEKEILPAKTPTPKPRKSPEREPESVASSLQPDLAKVDAGAERDSEATFSSTQVISDIDSDDFASTQVLPDLDTASETDHDLTGPAEQTQRPFTDTDVLGESASFLGDGSKTDTQELSADEFQSDTQVMQSLLDFEEFRGQDTDDLGPPPKQTEKSDRVHDDDDAESPDELLGDNELLSELEDIMEKQFEDQH